jgi:hypothetical protein
MHRAERQEPKIATEVLLSPTVDRRADQLRVLYDISHPPPDILLLMNAVAQ